MSVLGKKHQGKKSYAIGAVTVAAGVAVALGYDDPVAKIGGGALVAGGLSVTFIRAAIAKVLKFLEEAFEEKTGYEVPDDLAVKIGDQASEAAEAAVKKWLASLAETPETGNTVIVPPVDE